MAFGKREVKAYDIVVGLNSSVDGHLVSEGSIRIDGKVSGSIQSRGDVIIGDNAVVNSDIEAVYCEISGAVTGSVHTETQLKIFKSGNLNGDITVSSFTIEEGGIFRGNCDINPEKRERKMKPIEKKENPNKDQNNNNKNDKNKNNINEKRDRA